MGGDILCVGLPCCVACYFAWVVPRRLPPPSKKVQRPFCTKWRCVCRLALICCIFLPWWSNITISARYCILFSPKRLQRDMGPFVKEMCFFVPRGVFFVFCKFPPPL